MLGPLYLYPMAKGGGFMAKKKRRYSNRKKRRASSAYLDAHHIFFTKRHWRGSSYVKLRRHHYCIVMIPKNTLHRFIHQAVKDVPLPSSIAIGEALKQLQLLSDAGALHDDDPIDKRLRLLAALFDCAAQPTADALREQLDIVYRFYEELP